MRIAITCMSIVTLLAGGCEGGPDANVPAEGPPPVSGGGLEVVSDGAYAIASDPARASIHVIDLASRSDRRIQLGANDEPGRVVEDQDGNVHVVLRRSGEILTLDPSSATILRRRAVCAGPRGIDVDPDNGQLVVACAEGEIVRMPAGDGGAISRLRLASDLRDVIVESGNRMLVSRFRSADILMVQDGAVVGTVRPPSATGAFDPTRVLESTVAWRMRRAGDGSIVVMHQQSVSTQLGTLGGAPQVYYGGDCETGVVRPVITRVRPNWDTPDASDTSSVAVSSFSLGVDVDTTDDGALVAAAAAEPGDPTGGGFGFVTNFGGAREVMPEELQPTPTCNFDFRGTGSGEAEAAVAVADLPGDGYLVQYRDPARLVIRGMGSREIATIPFDAGDVTHVGHALFHEAAGTGATCAGCHPEGGDDGHVWAFDVGRRRSQTLLGGLLRTAPFHWDGRVADPGAVMEGTFVNRMGGAPPHPYEVDAFAEWMDRLPALPAPSAENHDAVARGAALYESAGCAGCHSGDMGTNNQTMDVGTDGRFQVPALYEIVYHAPYLHDGRAETLEDLVATHGNTGTLSEIERSDIAAYLRTL